FRVGLGVAPDYAFQFGFASVGTGSVNPATNKDSWLKQDVWSLGLQYHYGPRAYLRGTLGLGFVSGKAGSANFSGGHGFGAGGALGYEMVQRGHLALALELDGSVTHYPRESWGTAGLHLAVSLF